MANSTAAPEAVADRREVDPRPTAEPRPAKAQGTPDAQTGGPANRAARTEEAEGLERHRPRRRTARYFLTKPSSNGKPEFDEEMPDENQAMIEALKRDRHFVIVTEWRSKVDVSRGAPVIEKESVRRE